MPFTNVHPSGIGFESPNTFHERHLPTLREDADIAHAQGAKAVVQIAHSGSRADSSMTQGYDVVAPTGDMYGRFRTMSEQEAWEMVDSFAYSAELVMKAGFDGVEIHGANGWLIQQFTSAATNLRTDYWGGSLEKRLRFLLAIVDKIDEMWKKYNRPDFIIGYRFSPEEPGENGITMKETLALIDALRWKNRCNTCTSHYGISIKKCAAGQIPNSLVPKWYTTISMDVYHSSLREISTLLMICSKPIKQAGSKAFPLAKVLC